MIEVSYHCQGCGIDRAVTVPERQPGKDVRDWVQFAAVHVSRDHRLASPRSPSQRADIKIPLSGSEENFAPVGTIRKN